MRVNQIILKVPWIKLNSLSWLSRKIMLFVPAGDSVDHVIADLLPLLNPGDLIIDGGNSHFEDTNKRFNTLRANNIYFMGIGVSRI